MNTKEELKKMTLASLKDLMRKYSLKGITKLTKTTKDEYIDKIVEAQTSDLPKKKSPTKKPKSPEKKKSPVRKSPTKKPKSPEKKKSPVRKSPEKKKSPVRKSPTKKPKSPAKKKTPVKVGVKAKEKTISEIKQILKDKGITKGLPVKKEDLKKYAASAVMGKMCDPEKGIFCEGDKVCDSVNGLCVPKSATKDSYDELDFNGKKIVGPKTALAKLSKILNSKTIVLPPVESRSRLKSPVKIPSPRKKKSPPKGAEETKGSPVRRPSPRKEKIGGIVSPSKRIEGEDIVEGEIIRTLPSDKTVEEILEEIQFSPTELKSNIGEIRADILKCLGLL